MSNKLKCIYLDIDGVLANFHGAALALFGVDPKYGNEITDWDSMPKVIRKYSDPTITNQDFWNRIDNEGEKFWANLDWMPWGKELLYICLNTAPTVLMSAPTNHPSSASGKLYWIQNRMPSYWHKRYCLSPCKHHMAHPGALLIDDGEHNIKAFREHGGWACLIPNTWNSYGYFPKNTEVLNKVQETIENIKRN